MRIFKTKI